MAVFPFPITQKNKPPSFIFKRIDESVATVATLSFNYYLQNGHGDVVGLINDEGTVVNSYSYDAFGNTTSYAEKIANRFRYAGEQLDKVTGQYYLRARYYNPERGRFINADEIVGT